MPKLEAASPGAIARMEAQAAKIVNGQGKLWKVEKAGLAPSWLFGTLHLTDDRVTVLTPATQAAFDEADTVVIETTDILDPAKMAAAMATPNLTSLPGKETLQTVLPSDKYSKLAAALNERGIPPITVAKMKPWLITAVLAIPACEMARKAEGLPVLDEMLGKDALGTGKQLLGLETGLSQLQAMDKVPMEFHIAGLISLFKMGGMTNDVFERMTELYLKGQTGMIKPLFAESEKAMPELAGGMEGYAEFEQIMVDQRNKGMAENSAPILAMGDAFIAVGALHLPGENGLVEEFRKLGYTLTAVE